MNWWVSAPDRPEETGYREGHRLDSFLDWRCIGWCFALRCLGYLDFVGSWPFLRPLIGIVGLDLVDGRLGLVDSAWVFRFGFEDCWFDLQRRLPILLAVSLLLELFSGCQCVNGCKPWCYPVNPCCVFGNLGVWIPTPMLVLDQSLTPSPYGFAPPSSLLRTLWKSYLVVSSVNVVANLLSCRTKLAKFECLKCRGNTLLVNSLFYTQIVISNCVRERKERTSSTMKLSPILLHRTTCWYVVSSNILYRVSHSLPMTYLNNFLTYITKISIY